MGSPWRPLGAMELAGIELEATGPCHQSVLDALAVADLPPAETTPQWIRYPTVAEDIDHVPHRKGQPYRAVNSLP